MADREALLKLLDEYNMILETLRHEAQTEDTHNGSGRQDVANKLAYLEYRILQVETQLNLVDWNVHHLPGSVLSDDGNSESSSHPIFRQGDWGLWIYLAVWAVIILIVLMFNIFSALLSV